MKSIFVVSLLVLSYTGCKTDGSKDSQLFINQVTVQEDIVLPDNCYLIFIGYLEDFPIFKNVRGNELYISKETGILSLYQKIDKGQKPYFINDKVLVTSNDTDIVLNYSDGANEEIYIGSKIH